MGLVSRYLHFLASPGPLSDRKQWQSELEYQCSRMVPLAHLAGLAWLAYIPLDLALCPQVPQLWILRLGFLVCSGLVPVFKLFRPFAYHPMGLVLAVAFYLELATPLVTAMSGYQPAYMGGYIFILVLVALPPLPLFWSWTLLASSQTLFWLLQLAYPPDYGSPAFLYNLLDMASALVFCLTFSWILNRIRHRSWKQATRARNRHEALQIQRNHLRQILDELIPLDGPGNTHPVKHLQFPKALVMVCQLETPPGCTLGLVELQARHRKLAESLELLARKYRLQPMGPSSSHLLLFVMGIPDQLTGPGIRGVLAALDMLALARLVQAKDQAQVQIRLAIGQGYLEARELENGDLAYNIHSPSIRLTRHLSLLCPPGSLTVSLEDPGQFTPFFSMTLLTSTQGNLDLGSGGDAVAMEVWQIQGVLEDLYEEPSPGDRFKKRFSRVFGAELDFGWE